MHEGIFIAASAAYKQERVLAVITNNLANVNNTGFKRDGLVFKEILSPFEDDLNLDAAREILLSAELANPPTSYVGITEFYTDHGAGPQTQTGNSLDLAIEGEGFFVVQTNAGIRYTRNGIFRLDQDGHIVNQEGAQLLDKNKKPIKLDSRNGQISIDSSGDVFVGRGLANTPSGKIHLVKFADPSLLQKKGSAMYSWTGGPNGEQTIENPNIRQGFLEGSNVNAVQDMSRLMMSVRAFETYQKIIQTIDSADERSVNNIGRVV